MGDVANATLGSEMRVSRLRSSSDANGFEIIVGDCSPLDKLGLSKGLVFNRGRPALRFAGKRVNLSTSLEFEFGFHWLIWTVTEKGFAISYTMLYTSSLLSIALKGKDRNGEN
jgi:hypothetical protein